MHTGKSSAGAYSRMAARGGEGGEGRPESRKKPTKPLESMDFEEVESVMWRKVSIMMQWIHRLQYSLIFVHCTLLL